MARKYVRRKPKSQSEQANEKRSRALERAGTATIEGKPGKAKKILAAQKKRETKKPSAAQAAEALSEAHALEIQLTLIELEIEGTKERYKELKALREMLVTRIRAEVRDMGQGRLPFGAKSETAAVTAETKDAKGETKPAKGGTKAPENGTAAPGEETKPDEIEREMEGAEA